MVPGWRRISGTLNVLRCRSDGVSSTLSGAAIKQIGPPIDWRRSSQPSLWTSHTGASSWCISSPFLNCKGHVKIIKSVFNPKNLNTSKET